MPRNWLLLLICRRRPRLVLVASFVPLMLLATMRPACGQPEQGGADVTVDERATPSADILPGERWDEIRASSDRALRYLASHQQADGSFEAPQLGQPGITGLCTLAFLANGHLPGQGEHGDTLNNAVNFILKQQKANGLISVRGPAGAVVRRNGEFSHEVGVAGSYNHAISALALSEVYGAGGVVADEAALSDAVEAAVQFTLLQQKWPQPRKDDEGGWRYLHSFAGTDADLPVTGWHLMLLRSAKNAGFDVPQASIDDGAAYVVRCFDQGRQMFDYDATGSEGRNRAMAGVGILALAHASKHNQPEALTAADFILREGFSDYNETNLYNPVNRSERYHYSVCQCSLAMYQVGGDRWAKFFPPLVDTLLAHQNPDGSWDPESNRDTVYGQSYTTALVVIALSAPNQLLPVFQR